MRVAIVGGREFHDRAGLRHIIEIAGLAPIDDGPCRVVHRFETV